VIIAEASAVVDALVDTPPSHPLLAVLSDEELHAPALLDFEVASALRGHVRAARITPGRLREALADFAALSIERHHMTALLGRMLELRENFIAYDAAYVALAMALRAPLVTADAKLRAAERLGVTVRVYH
jgi:predicted nucleic acid-binding protein